MKFERYKIGKSTSGKTFMHVFYHHLSASDETASSDKTYEIYLGKGINI